MYLLFGKRYTSTHRRFRQVSSQGFERFVMLIKWTDSTAPALYRGVYFYKVRIFMTTYINTVHSVLEETLIDSLINGTLPGHPKLAIDQVSKTWKGFVSARPNQDYQGIVFLHTLTFLHPIPAYRFTLA